MPIELLACTVFGFLVVVAGHEFTHVLIARAHGHPTVCVAVNPVGVAVVFEDTPSPSYWIWQLVTPMLVTALLCYGWLFAVLSLPAGFQSGAAARGLLDMLPQVAALLAILSSGGDMFGFLVELRRPVHGDERICRDFRVLRRLPGIVCFTRYGRERWGSAWLESGRWPITEPPPAPAGAD